jgi:AraC family transcriptional activator of pobA
MRNPPYNFRSIADLHRLFFLPPPQHPLITVFELDDKTCQAPACSNSLVFDFYSIWCKHNASGILGYGQKAFDFSTGALTFQGPGQVISVHGHDFSAGWCLAFHPDLFREFSLIQSIKEYSFFSYEVFQGLNLTSAQEEMVTELIIEIGKECQAADERFSTPVLVAQLELLLRQLNRLYHYQFRPNERTVNDFLSVVENELQQYFNPRDKTMRPLLTVSYLADRLHLTPHHLSDKLKDLTGSSALQHIHYKMVENAKDLISTTSLSMSEIAYLLGFEHPQSFSKVFKSKTGLSPTLYKQSLNNHNSI